MYYPLRPFRRLASGRWLKERDVPRPLGQARLSACYRGNIASGAVDAASSHGPHNEDTVLLYRTIIGALLTEVIITEVSSATIYWWLTTFRAASKSECCRPLGHILDYPVLFKVTQKTTPATFIEWRNMFGNKAVNSFFPFFHLTNIDGFINVMYRSLHFPPPE